MRRVALLGATGSIGTAAQDLARAYPDRIRLVSLAARSNHEALIRAAEEFRVPRIALVDPEAARRARSAWKGGEVLEGEEALAALAAEDGVDVVVNAVVGGIGLKPTVAALSAGKRVALANKESVVLAGELLLGIAKRSGGASFPWIRSTAASLSASQPGRSRTSAASRSRRPAGPSCAGPRRPSRTRLPRRF